MLFKNGGGGRMGVHCLTFHENEYLYLEIISTLIEVKYTMAGRTARQCISPESLYGGGHPIRKLALKTVARRDKWMLGVTPIKFID